MIGLRVRYSCVTNVLLFSAIAKEQEERISLAFQCLEKELKDGELICGGCRAAVGALCYPSWAYDASVRRDRIGCQSDAGT